MRCSKARRRAKAAGALAFTMMVNGSAVVMAQAPATVAPPAISAAPGLGTGPTAPATAGTGTTGPVRTLTLEDVVNLAVNNNSSVALARQRLQRTLYQINATNAQALPQVSGSVVDTYNSQRSFGTSAASVSTPTLAGGGTIPTITDQGGGTTSTFVGGGGGGTAASSGSFSSNTGSTSAPATNSGTNVSVTSPGNQSGTGTTAGTGGSGTGGTGTGTTGTITVPGANTGTGTGGGTGAGAQAIERDGLPPIAQKFAAVTNQSFTPVPGQAAQSRAVAHAGGGGTGTGTTGGSGGGGTGSGTTGSTASGNSGQYNNYSGRVSVTQYIDIFGLVPTTLDVEKITREFYQIDLERVQNETALAAKDDFFTALRDQAQVAVDQEQVNAAAANLRITQVRQIAGTAAEGDVLNAQVTLSNDQQAQTAAQNTLNLALANLDNLLGVSPETDIALQPPPLPSLTANVDLRQSTQVALTQRPELRQAENNIVIANKLIRLAGASLLPTLGVSGVASYAGNVSPGGTHDDYTVTAEINIPLFDGGYTRAQVNTAKLDLTTQITTRDQLRQNVILEVKQAYLNIQNDQGSAATAAVGVASAREAARIAGLQYQYGTNTFLNLLNAQTALATAETDYYNDEFSYQTDLATLVRAIGGR